MQEVTITLTAQEAVDITNIIGQLPTQSNAHPLWLKLRNQVEPQLPKPEEVSSDPRTPKVL
jgi:hypothetical protein